MPMSVRSTAPSSNGRELRRRGGAKVEEQVTPVCQSIKLARLPLRCTLTGSGTRH